jgi:hypothetical protein
MDNYQKSAFLHPFGFTGKRVPLAMVFSGLLNPAGEDSVWKIPVYL